MEQAPPTGQIQRAALLLNLLAEGRETHSIRELALRSGLSKSAVQRLLTELVGVDLAAQDPSSKQYRLGPRTLAIGLAFQQQLDIRQLARPHMTRLRDRSGETVGLSVALGEELIHIDQVESTSTLRALFELGQPLPLWCGAPARILLAERSPEDARRLATRRTPTNITPVAPPTADELVDDLVATRDRGYASALEETLPGVCTVSAPIRRAGGGLAAILSITGPRLRLDQRHIAELAPDLLATAAEIGSDLGWFGDAIGVAAD